MIIYRKRFCHYTSSLNGNPDIDRVAKWISVRIDCLPGAFINAFLKRRGEKNSEGCLCPGPGRIERDLFRCAKRGAADVSQPIGGIPVAGAAVLHQPLLIKRQSECG